MLKLPKNIRYIETRTCSNCEHVVYDDGLWWCKRANPDAFFIDYDTPPHTYICDRFVWGAGMPRKYRPLYYDSGKD